MDIQVIINQMLQLLLVISLGYFLFKVKIFDEVSNKKLTVLLLSVTSPALIISSVLTSDADVPNEIVYFTFILALLLYLLMPLFGFLVSKMCRAKKDEMGLFMFMTVFSNISFMGFPVMESIFGVEAIFYAAIFNLMFNLFMFSVGKIMISYGRENKVDITLKSMLSPGVVASLIALFIYFTKITIPSVFTNTIVLVGSITSPIAMLLIGSSLAIIPLKEVFGDLRIYFYAFIRQIIIPICVFPILNYLIEFELLLGVTFIVISMPIANSAILFATRYDGDIKLAAKSVFMTTLLSIVSIPLLVYLFLI